MKLEEIVNKIESESDMKNDEIKERIKEKQEELGGLVTQEGAAHIVANEIGINLFNGAPKVNELKIENIIPGMSNVDVVGRIDRIFPLREFEKKDGGTGRVVNLILSDDTGTIRVVFWGKDTAAIEEGRIKEGDVLRLRRGYTKENTIKGEPEIHVGTRTRVIQNPGDISAEEFPSQEGNWKKTISELNSTITRVDVLCKVLRIYETREFDRKDGSKGKVVNMAVADETGSTRLVLWDEDVGLVENGQIKQGDAIRIQNGYIKMNLDSPEINIGRYGKIIINPKEGESLNVVAQNFEYAQKKITELKNGDRAAIRGILVDVFDIRVFNRKDGKKGMVLNGVFDDGTSSITVVFYDKIAESLTNIPLEKLLEEDVNEQWNNRKREILGKEIILKTRVRHSDFSGKDELIVNDIDLRPDPRKEARSLLEEAKTLVR